MITVLFPPGCYGTFLSNCIYKFSELNEDLSRSLAFDEQGSSHSFRYDRYAKTKISTHHIDTHQPGGDTFVILPKLEHALDYFNNQFAKQELGNLVDYICNHFSIEEIKFKLSSNWNYHSGLSVNTPAWILREWCSLWLNDCLTESYGQEKYAIQSACAIIDTDDLFDSFVPTIHNILTSLSLSCQVTDATLEKTASDFKKVQLFHNSQMKCNKWITDVIDSKFDNNIDLNTIFDEAYIQQQLRFRGWEIKCDGLNMFPRSSLTMKQLLYRI